MTNLWRTIWRVALACIAFSVCAKAAVFQYQVPVKTPKDPASALLWIPPQAPHVRGVVILGKTLAEPNIVVDAQIRAACAEAQLAIVYLTCGIGSADIQTVLNDLAGASGYPEIRIAPLFFAGHSAGGPPAKDLAIKFADRCFGLMQYRGGVPGDANNPKYNVSPSVPALAMVGQFDEFGGRMRDENGRENAWEMGRDGLLVFRGSHPAALGSIVAEPGAGHFAWSDRNAAYLAMFIKKAAAARIPDFKPDAPDPVVCRPIDPASGWLADLKARTFDLATPQPYDAYTGDKSKAQWFFDEEIAKANVAYHVGFSKKDQFIKWDHDVFIDAGVRYFINNYAWVSDGTQMQFRPAYADAYPKTQPNGPRWADAGKPAGHSESPIKLRVAGGPLEVAGDQQLRVNFTALDPATTPVRGTFIAFSEGDDTYRYTEQVGMLPRGFKSFGGKPQKIDFPPIGDLKPDAAAVDLKATSDRGLPVRYYVAVGPAIVRDGKLVLTDLPARGKFPIDVTVVAWQFGIGGKEGTATAAPVSQTFKILAP